jgi:hypothetical protein
VYGAVEAGIGVYCLLFPWIFPLARSASICLPTGEGALAFAVDTAFSAFLIVPPATLMGGTIPILTQALARNLTDATRVHALIYGWNTRGRVPRRARDRLLPGRVAGPRRGSCTRWDS